MSVATFDNGGSGRFASARRGSAYDDLAFVQAKLNRGVSASHIARMANRPLSAIQSMIDRLRGPLPERAAVQFPWPEPRPGTRAVLSLFRGLLTVPLTTAAIIHTVAEEWGCSTEEIVGPSRARPVVYARQDAMWRMREAGFSSPLIGRELGDRDHTTVLYGAAEHEKRQREAARV